jgi:hypothetical protein
MAQDIDKIRDFVLHFEKGLTTRRLYAPHMAPYKDSFAKILEKCQAALAELRQLRGLA